jgi:peptide deformylase
MLGMECEDVVAGDHTGEWARNLVDTMHAANGWGLAAPQIGILKRMFVVHVPQEQREPIIMINPQWGVRVGDTQVLRPEGCLSFPGIQSEADRFDHVLAQWTDMEGRVHQERFDGWTARAIQHECDHLFGKLITDQVTPVRRKRIVREMERHHRETAT